MKPIITAAVTAVIAAAALTACGRLSQPAWCTLPTIQAMTSDSVPPAAREAMREVIVAQANVAADGNTSDYARWEGDSKTLARVEKHALAVVTAAGCIQR